MKISQLTSYPTGEKKSFSSTIRNEARMPTIATSIQHSPESPNQGNWATENNGIQTGKKK